MFKKNEGRKEEVENNRGKDRRNEKKAEHWVVK